MNLDLQACSRARLTRDPRFDGKERSLFSQCGSGGGSRLSSLLALPAGEFTGNASLVGNFKHRLASVAFDRRERLGGRWGRCPGGAIGSWIATSAALVFEASRRYSDGGSTHPPSALRQKTDRRNESAHASSCVGLGVRQRSTI